MSVHVQRCAWCAVYTAVVLASARGTLTALIRWGKL